jgi:hypothetical protein
METEAIRETEISMVMAKFRKSVEVLSSQVGTLSERLIPILRPDNNAKESAGNRPVNPEFGTKDRKSTRLNSSHHGY